MRHPEVVYIVLGGENPSRRSRSNSFLEAIQCESREWVAIFSGKSGFDPHIRIAQAEDMLTYCSSQGVDTSRCLCESYSYDTLGNMICTKEMLLHTFGEIYQDTDIEIVTDDFHRNRAEWIRQFVFCETITLRHDYGEQSSCSELSHEHVDVLSNATDHFRSHGNLLKEFRALLSHEEHIVKEFFKKQILLYDMLHFRIDSYEKLRDYTYQLPGYRDIFSPHLYTFAMKESLYSHVIVYKMSIS